MIPQHASALLISDIHLTPSMPLTAQRFFDFCEKDAPQVESVFILGDLFEYWVGDDSFITSPFGQEVKRALATLSTKTKIYYVHGNRDFLIGNTFLKITGMTLLTDPSVVEIAKQHFVISHGDALCTADIGYQVFRRWVRKSWLQKLFLQLPVEWRRAIANQLRSNSYAKYQRGARHSSPSNLVRTNVTLEACGALIAQTECKQLIHGHTHLPGQHHEQLGELQWQRWVLSDWDLDHPESTAPRASALLINAEGVRFVDLVRP